MLWIVKLIVQAEVMQLILTSRRTKQNRFHFRTRSVALVYLGHLNTLTHCNCENRLRT